jgi:SAM-dependent methyltransferase
LRRQSSAVLAQALRRAWARHGLAGTVARLPHYVLELGFDAWNGVRTAGLVQLGGRDPLDGGGGFYAYAPVPIRSFRAAMIQFRVPTDQTFVDFGCGKGRALVLAARFGFGHVVGVELDGDLYRQGQQNLVSFARRSGSRAQVQIVCKEAAAYEVRPDQGVFFLYNPFPAEVLRAVLDNIQRSLGEHPRMARLIYAYPAHAEVLDSNPFWRRTDSLVWPRFGEIHLYEPSP